MDLVVPVRAGLANDELRYAMRSWEKNLQHFRQVWVVGSAPGWLNKDAVRFVKVSHDRTGSTKYARTTANLRAVMEERDLSANFVIANDDMFATEPTHIPAWHRGPIAEVVEYYKSRMEPSAYVLGMERTRSILQDLGFRDPLSYELHVPMIVNKHLMSRLLEAHADVPALHKRSLYANVAHAGGEYHPDVKVYSQDQKGPYPAPWVSTSDASFKRGLVGEHLREAFPVASSFEMPRRDARRWGHVASV